MVVTADFDHVLSCECLQRKRMATAQLYRTDDVMLFHRTAKSLCGVVENAVNYSTSNQMNEIGICVD